MNIKLSENGISDFFQSMIDRTNLVAGWLNRVAYPTLLKAQRVRWQTEGASEGVKWKPLTSLSYKRYKLRKFADYPGAGTKLLIATNRLVDSMTGVNKTEHFKLVDKGRNRLEMGSLVPYGAFQEDQGRDQTTLGESTVDGLVESLRAYIVNGTMKGGA